MSVAVERGRVSKPEGDSSQNAMLAKPISEGIDMDGVILKAGARSVGED